MNHTRLIVSNTKEESFFWLKGVASGRFIWLEIKFRNYIFLVLWQKLLTWHRVQHIVF